MNEKQQNRRCMNLKSPYTATYLLIIRKYCTKSRDVNIRYDTIRYDTRPAQESQRPRSMPRSMLESLVTKV